LQAVESRYRRRAIAACRDLRPVAACGRVAARPTRGEAAMELRIEQLAGDVTRVIPVGRWDITGAEQIDLRLSAIAGSGRPVVIDCSEVSYLSSMGIRSIVMSAKAVQLKGRKLVLLSPVPHVEAVLTIAGIDTFVPIYRDLDEATQAASA
jgi:anti-anti-sigma factor